MSTEAVPAQDPVDVKASPLPCPFCGGKAVAHETRSGWWVGCTVDACLIRPTTVEPRHRVKDAIADWNKRANAEASDNDTASGGMIG